MTGIEASEAPQVREKRRQPIPKGGLDHWKERGVLARVRAHGLLWRQVEQKLKAGEPCPRIARWILSTKKVEGLTEKDLPNLKNKLLITRKRLAPLDVVPPEKVPLFLRQKVQELQQGDNRLKHLYWLRREQERRIRQARKTEQKLPVTMRQLTEDIKVAREIEQTILELSMELGLHKRAPMQIQAAHVGLYADVQRLPVESRERVLRAAQRFLAAAKAGPNGQEAEREPGPPPAPEVDGETR